MANNNRFSPIFEQDGEDPTPSGSNSRSKKPAAKRSRQETPSPPHTPAARAHAPLAIEAPPLPDDTAITSRLDEIELTLQEFLQVLTVLAHSRGPIAVIEGIAALSKKVDDLLARLSRRTKD
jgi:hypothetical protein